MTQAPYEEKILVEEVKHCLDYVEGTMQRLTFPGVTLEDCIQAKKQFVLPFEQDNFDRVEEELNQSVMDSVRSEMMSERSLDLSEMESQFSSFFDDVSYEDVTGLDQLSLGSFSLKEALSAEHDMRLKKKLGESFYDQSRFLEDEDDLEDEGARDRGK